MAILSFHAEAVRRIVTHAKAAPTHDMGWLNDTDSQPAVMLVGDHGVYLMSNGLPRDRLDADNDVRNFVAHALGINPYLDTDWWEEKRKAYGGDDGADTLLIIESLELLFARGEAFIRLEITEDHIGVVVPDVSWITKGTLVETPTGLGGVFRARVLSVTDTHASVRNTGNCEGFDTMPPYLVPLGHVRAVKTAGAN